MTHDVKLLDVTDESCIALFSERLYEILHVHG